MLGFRTTGRRTASRKLKILLFFLWVKNNYAQIVYPEIYYLCAQEK